MKYRHEMTPDEIEVVENAQAAVRLLVGRFLQRALRLGHDIDVDTAFLNAAAALRPALTGRLHVDYDEALQDLAADDGDCDVTCAQDFVCRSVLEIAAYRATGAKIHERKAAGRFSEALLEWERAVGVKRAKWR